MNLKKLIISIIITLQLPALSTTLHAIEFFHNGIQSGSIKSEQNKLIYTSQTQQFYGNSELQEATISGNITIAPQSGISSETLGNKSIYLAKIGGTTITLPKASENQGKLYTVKKANFNTAINTIQAQTNETIDGNPSVKLHTPQEALTLISDGSDWHIINHYSIYGSINQRIEGKGIYQNKTNKLIPIYKATIPETPKGLYKITWYYESFKYSTKKTEVEHHIYVNNTLLSMNARHEGFPDGDFGRYNHSGFGYTSLKGDGTDQIQIIVRYQTGFDLSTAQNNLITQIKFELTLIQPNL